MHLLKLILCLSFLSSLTYANEQKSPVENISINQNNVNNFTIQNLSSVVFKVTIFSDDFNIKPNSGLIFECSDFHYVSLDIKEINHDFFEVPCQTTLVVEEDYMLNTFGDK